MVKLTELSAWKALQTHYASISSLHMKDFFQQDPFRFDRFSLHLDGLLVDYSKNRITNETITLLTKLADEIKLSDQIEALFTGKAVNFTEKKPALHTALRTFNTETSFPAVRVELEKMRKFTQGIHSGQIVGLTGKPFKHIVTIGLGGSHLGAQMACHALQDYAIQNIQCHFISNIDGKNIHHVLKQIDAETTLFIIASKSFTTYETLVNAKTLRNWLQKKLSCQHVSEHFVAVTANTPHAQQFGVREDYLFQIWDWVGGRYSIWSAMGLPLAILIGMPNFLAFLEGAYVMDQHFRHTSFSKNIPVLLGLLGIWYINFFQATHHVITPYSYALTYFRQYIQQADMESNGKMVNQLGKAIDYTTSPVIFGEQGCDGQHSYHQFLHQGPLLMPVDFILVGQCKHFSNHQDILIASALSQSKALMQGKTFDEGFIECINQGLTEEEATYLAAHKNTPGNRPSTTLFLNKISPHTLGALIALYEHKIFVQGVIWGINSFDQWGIELGKQLMPNVLSTLKRTTKYDTDSSTQGLAQFYKNLQGMHVNEEVIG